MSVLQTGEDGTGVGVEIERRTKQDGTTLVQLTLLPYPAVPRREELTEEQAITLAGMLVCAATGGFDTVGAMKKVEALAAEIREYWRSKFPANTKGPDR